jgi:hypothetical protein
MNAANRVSIGVSTALRSLHFFARTLASITFGTRPPGTAFHGNGHFDSADCGINVGTF